MSPIAIAWSDDGLIGRLTIDGELWAEVEWSEKRQRWCIQDAEGRCLSHQDHVHGAAADRTAAVSLAEAMIRDGRMPTPEEAKRQADERRNRAREKRQQQPAEIRKREQRKRDAEAIDKGWRAQAAEDEAPLYEALADAFDFADPELWKSNSFAALKPRLVLHLRNAIAVLERDLVYHRGSGLGREIEAKLARAREILSQLASGASQ